MACLLLAGSLMGLQPVSLAMSVQVPVLRHRTGIALIQDSEYVTLSKASSYIQKGADASAIPLLINTTEQNPMNILGLFHLGSAYLELAKQADIPEQRQVFLDQAQQAFERVADLNSDLTLTYFKLGKIALMKGDMDKAKQVYRQGLDVEPNNAALIFNLARVYDQNNEHAEAIRYYEKTLQADPGFTYAYNNLALLYEEEHNYTEAEKAYKMALKKDNAYNLARLNLGNLYANQGNYAAAKHMFAEAEAQEPQNAWVYYYQGNLCLRMSDYEKAVTAYNKSIELNPKNATTYYLLAVSLSKLKRMDDALQASLHYMQTDPNGPYAKEMQSLIMAMKLSQSGEFYLSPMHPASQTH
jgi:tetratricopeptide (TPR) repeat protein